MKNRLNTEFPGIGDAQFHIRLTEGQISPYVLLPGEPERVELVKKQWKNAVDLEFNREFRSAKGTYDGMDIACVSTGIGTTSAEICLHELKNIGAHTTVRIGTTGAISERFQPGSLIIPVAAIRADGTSDCYVDKAFPAVADRMVVNAFSKPVSALATVMGQESCTARLHSTSGKGAKSVKMVSGLLVPST